VTAPCTVKLSIFEGPLDLLLHLIKRNEVQVTDIPISAITDQYLALLEELPELNLDGAGEYLVMAATLQYIKSRMLLPAAEDEEAEEDPRAELVQQLAEYQRFREVGGRARRAERARARRLRGRGERPSPAAGATSRSGPGREPRGLARRAARRPAAIRPPRAHEIEREPISIRACVARILASSRWTERRVREPVRAGSTRRRDHRHFLALLELIRLRVLRAARRSASGDRLELGVATVEAADAPALNDTRIRLEGGAEGRGMDMEQRR
jgi:segregation and condensation protein A